MVVAEESLQRAVQVVKSVLEHHRVRVVQIFLFGSRARGDADPGSDWDLFVLVENDLTFPQRRRLITEIKRKLARLRIPNDIVLKSSRSFHRTKSYPGHLAYDVGREGIPLL